MIKEKEVMYANGDFWVLRGKTGYSVCRDVGTHSIDCGAEWLLNQDGLYIAKAYCDRLAKSAESALALLEEKIKQ